MSIKLKITITADIIRRSICEDVHACAIAIAVREIFPHAAVFLDAIVPFSYHLKMIENTQGLIEKRQAFPIPLDMTDFISNFDNGLYEDLKDDIIDEFELEIPDWVVNTINIDEVRPLLEGHPTLQIVE